MTLICPLFTSTPETEFELHRLHILYDIVHHMKIETFVPKFFVKMYSEKFRKFKKNRPVLEFLFDKVACLTQVCS